MATNDVERRRFARRTEHEGENDSLAELHAELVLLREENARLKAAEHAGPDIEGLLARAGRLAEATLDHRETEEDEATGVLVEGLAIRESLLEICSQIERVMVLFEKRLRALGAEPEPEPPAVVHIGHWAEPPATGRTQERDGDGPRAA